MNQDEWLKKIDAFDKLDAFVLGEKFAKHFEWMKWSKEIPYIQFPSHWFVKIIPPFRKAIVRFWIRKDSNLEKQPVSVYLDCYNYLGFFDVDEKGNAVPYWEIYPSSDGDPARYPMDDIPGLIQGIEEALNANR